EHGDNQRHVLDRTLHDDERIGFAGVFVRSQNAVRIALAVLELEDVGRQHFGADLVTAPFIQQRVEAGTRLHAVVVAALGADALIAFQIGAVQDSFAGRALAPQAFGDRLFDPFDAFDLGGQQFLDPAHSFSSGALLGGMPPVWVSRTSAIWLAMVVKRAPFYPFLSSSYQFLTGMRGSPASDDLSACRSGESYFPSRAARMVRRKVRTLSGASLGSERSISSMMRLPITTASATAPIFLALSASRIPKPTPTGMPTIF